MVSTISCFNFSDLPCNITLPNSSYHDKHRIMGRSKRKRAQQALFPFNNQPAISGSHLSFKGSNNQTQNVSLFDEDDMAYLHQADPQLDGEASDKGLLSPCHKKIKLDPGERTKTMVSLVPMELQAPIPPTERERKLHRFHEAMRVQGRDFKVPVAGQNLPSCPDFGDNSPSSAVCI